MALIKGNAQQDKIQRYWYQNDQLGTPIRLTDSLGETLYQCEYNAYGQVIDENYYCDNIDTRPNNPLRFQGQYYDEESDLHYNLNRYYDPLAGRYITQDPEKLAGGLNFYQYVEGNPVGWIDPLGLFKQTSKGDSNLTVAKSEPELLIKAGGTGKNYEKHTGQGVYVLYDKQGIIRYIGRGDAPTRIAAHFRSPDKAGLDNLTLWRNNLTETQAKALEQALIDHFGKSIRENPLTPLQNKIRSISLKNRKIADYSIENFPELWEKTLEQLKKEGLK